MRFYIAASLANAQRVKAIQDILLRNGHIISCDWVSLRDVRGQGKDVLFETAYKEVFAVTDADFVLALLPGGPGTHTELGLALASRNNKRIVLWSGTGHEFADGDETCVFYHHTAVEQKTCSFDELLAFISTI